MVQRTNRRWLIERILEALPGSMLVTDIDRTSSGPGSHVLLLHLQGKLDFTRGSLRHTFAPGWYVYAGSADGPGGVRARIRRHQRSNKVIHCHSDSLTVVADAIEAFVAEQGHEYELITSLVRSGIFQSALRRFGSSDCTKCETHLLTVKK